MDDDDSDFSDAGDGDIGSRPDNRGASAQASQQPSSNEAFNLPVGDQWIFTLGVTGSSNVGVVGTGSISSGYSFVLDVDNAELRLGQYYSYTEPGDSAVATKELRPTGWFGISAGVGKGSYDQGFLGPSVTGVVQAEEGIIFRSESRDVADNITARMYGIGVGFGSGYSATAEQSRTEPIGETERVDLNLERHIMRWMGSYAPFWTPRP